MRKIFRIEELTQLSKMNDCNSEGAKIYQYPKGDDSQAYSRHAEIMTALNKLLLGGLNTPIHTPQPLQDQLLVEIKKNMIEAQKLKTELDTMLDAIHKTKADIAALHVNALDNGSVSRVSDELDAIVTDTECATNSLLNAAEAIDTNANQLSAALKGTQRDQANDISEQIIKIYEACNFQDITGQRINKVIKLLRFIEERIHSMMDIWGGLEEFKNVLPTPAEAPLGDKALLNGPSLSSDENKVNQDDIDALFA